MLLANYVLCPHKGRFFSNPFPRILAFPVVVVGIVLAGFSTLASPALAQTPRPSLEGNVSAYSSPSAFDLNGRHVVTLPGTGFGKFGSPYLEIGGDAPTHLGYGAFVLIRGKFDSHQNAWVATAVFTRDEENEKLSGVGVVDKVLSRGSETILRADGHRMRLTGTTKTEFSKKLATLADVQPGTPIRFSGNLSPDGSLSLSEARFFPAVVKKPKGIPVLETYEDHLTAPDYAHGTAGRVKLGLFGGWHKIPADPKLQDRVNRVGMLVVPAYQNAMAEDDPLKIHFRFYAVDDKAYRGEICHSGGLVLIPTQVIDRLKNDDQLATLLADGVAFSLQNQWNRTITSLRVMEGVIFAGDVVGAFIPGAGLVGIIGGGVAENKYFKMLQQQRARVSLALMADAGFDLHQAPVAWQLLAPRRPVQNAEKELPKDHYPPISNYILGVLHQEYRTTPECPTSTVSVESIRDSSAKK